MRARWRTILACEGGWGFKDFIISNRVVEAAIGKPDETYHNPKQFLISSSPSPYQFELCLEHPRPRKIAPPLYISQESSSPCPPSIPLHKKSSKGTHHSYHSRPLLLPLSKHPRAALARINRHALNTLNSLSPRDPRPACCRPSRGKSDPPVVDISRVPLFSNTPPSCRYICPGVLLLFIRLGHVFCKSV